MLHVCSDKAVKNNFELIETETNGITNITVYYKKVNSKIPLVSDLKKRKRLVDAFELGYQKLLSKTSVPDLIQLNVVMPAGIGVAYLCKKYNIPYVINEGWTGYTPQDGNYKGAALKYFTKKIVSKARAIMPVSEHLEKAMLAHGLTGTYFVVPNVVDVSVFKPGETKTTSRKNFIHISALDDTQKNVSAILRAFAMAQKTHAGISLSIVGEGDDKAGLMQLTKQLALEHSVRFTGRLQAGSLVNEINRADALVMFSNYESFCLAVVEALACGKPVITSRAGGVTSQITPELGVMVEPKDEAALLNALNDFLERKHQYDEIKMRHFVEEHFSKAIIAQKLNEVYDFALTGK